MKSWNTIGKIKAIIIAVAGFINLLNPFKPIEQTDFLSNFIISPIGVFLFAIIIRGLPAVFSKNKILQPKWNDNPFRNSMAAANFFALFFIIVGSCMMISTAIKFKILNSFGLISFSFGLGILIGDFLALRISKPKRHQSR